MVLVPLALTACSNGKVIDPAQGGDLAAIHDAGWGCVDYDASVDARYPGPSCTAEAGTEDPVCDQWIRTTEPAGMATAACGIKFQPPPYFCVGDVLGPPACNAGPSGDAFCDAWATQYVVGDGRGLSFCGVPKGKDTGFCALRWSCGQPAGAYDCFCVERNGTAGCEAICQK